MKENVHYNQIPGTAFPVGEVIENKDPEVNESLLYVFKDSYGEMLLKLSDILSCLRFAGKQGVLPVFSPRWWSMIEMLYPHLAVPFELWTKEEATYGKLDAPMAQKAAAEPAFFLLQDTHRRFTIRLVDSLECLIDAERRFAIPEVDPGWWAAVRILYPDISGTRGKHEEV